MLRSMISDVYELPVFKEVIFYLKKSSQEICFHGVEEMRVDLLEYSKASCYLFDLLLYVEVDSRWEVSNELGK
jgi:hypothetical protein